MSEKKKSYIDDYALASKFEEGDAVRFPILRSKSYSPYPGKVVTVLDGIGMLDVATSMGTFRVNAHEVVKDDSQNVDYLEDLEPETWDKSRYRGDDMDEYSYSHPRVAQKYYNNRIRPVAKKARDAMEKVPPKKASKAVFKKFIEPCTFEEIHTAVEVANSTRTKSALYWKEKGRQYMPTQNEWEEGDFNCPQCKTKLTPKKYKHDETDMEDHLYVCNRCLWMIRPEDMVDKEELSEEQEEMMEEDIEEDGSFDHFEEEDPVLEEMIE